MSKNTGHVVSVNGNMVAARFSGSIVKNEVAYIIVGESRLKGEVIRINGDIASLQVYEMTVGVGVGDLVEFTGELLSVELGPGLLSQIYDGLQNPLPELAERCGHFLQRGVYLDAIPDRDWDFTPVAKVGDRLVAGDCLGTVPEGAFTHRIMLPFNLAGSLCAYLAMAGLYNAFFPRISLISVSIAGAIVSNIARTGVAAAVMEAPSLFVQLPAVCAVSVAAGIIIGVLTTFSIKHLPERLTKFE